MFGWSEAPPRYRTVRQPRELMRNSATFGFTAGNFGLNSGDPRKNEICSTWKAPKPRAATNHRLAAGLCRGIDSAFSAVRQFSIGAERLRGFHTRRAQSLGFS